VIGLVRVEVLRLFSRRLLKLAAAGVLLLVALIVGIDGYNSANVSAAADAEFRARRAAAYDRDVAFLQQLPESDRPPLEHLPPREAVISGSDCFGPETCAVSRKQPYVVRDKLDDFGKAVAVICAFAAFLIGASAAGAEWSAGTMQSLLFWEPRRIRVVIGKVAGLVTVIGLLVACAEILFSAGALIAGELRGSTAGLTSGVWTSYLLLVLRAVAFAGFASVLGFSIAFGTRVTAAAVGIAFIYFAILENLLLVWKEWLGKYTIGRLLDVWLNNGAFVESPRGDRFPVTGQRAGITLAIYALVMLTAATVWFRQRDVT
jgi:ABC-2 type transport system permease protein